MAKRVRERPEETKVLANEFIDEDLSSTINSQLNMMNNNAIQEENSEDKPERVIYQYPMIAKISNTLLWIDHKTILKVAVSLFNRGKKKNEEKAIHREVKFTKTTTGKTAININLAANAVVTIEHRDFNVNMKNIHMYHLSEAIKTWYDILTNHYDEWFGKIDGSFMILKTSNPVEIECLYGDKIWITPCLIEKTSSNQEREQGGIYQGGIQIIVNRPEWFIPLTMEQMLELKITLDQINLPMMELELLNYIGRPELGYNMFDMDANKSKPAFFKRK